MFFFFDQRTLSIFSIDLIASVEVITLCKTSCFISYLNILWMPFEYYPFYSKSCQGMKCVLHWNYYAISGWPNCHNIIAPIRSRKITQNLNKHSLIKLSYYPYIFLLCHIWAWTRNVCNHTNVYWPMIIHHHLLKVTCMYALNGWGDARTYEAHGESLNWMLRGPFTLKVRWGEFNLSS